MGVWVLASMPEKVPVTSSARAAPAGRPRAVRTAAQWLFRFTAVPRQGDRSLPVLASVRGRLYPFAGGPDTVTSRRAARPGAPAGLRHPGAGALTVGFRQQIRGGA